MLKKLLVLLVAAFAVYYLLQTPQGAADAVSDAGGALMDAFSQIGVFVDSLTS